MDRPKFSSVDHARFLAERSLNVEEIFLLFDWFFIGRFAVNSVVGDWIL